MSEKNTPPILESIPHAACGIWAMIYTARFYRYTYLIFSQNTSLPSPTALTLMEAHALAPHSDQVVRFHLCFNV